MLVVAGKFDESKTLAKINDIFGRIPRPQRQLEKTYTVEPVQDGEREVVLRRVGDVQAIGAAYHICAGPHQDAAPLQVLESILTAEQTGRLYKALIEPKLATSVRASAESLYDPGIFMVMAEARVDQPIDKVRSVMFEVLDGLGRQTFTDEEVERAKKAFARNFDLMLNDSGRVGLRLTESAAQGDWRLMFLQRDRMAKVTPADVQRVAATYFKPSNRTVGVFQPTKSPERAPIPATPDVASLFKDYKGGQELAAGEAFEATYASIDSRTQRSTLPIGMKLALLKKETRGDRVNVNMTFRYGSEADLTGKTEAANFMASMLMRGTKNMTRRQIQDRFAELKAQVRIGAGGGPGGGRGRMMRGPRGAAGAIDVSIETTRENLMPVLDLVGEILRQPSFPADEFDILQKETLAGVEEQMSEPTALAMIEMQRRLNPYPPTDVRYVPTLAEQLERIRAVKLDDVKAVYSGLVGASASEVAAVGDFDPAQLTATLDKNFGGWASPRPFKRIETPYQKVAPDTLVLNTPDKANSLFTIGLPIEIRDDDPDYPALFMANYILGGNPGSRLLNRIRQKEGLSYSVNSSFNASPLDRRGTFSVFAICAPENCEKALACGREEVDRLLREGLTQQELDTARQGYRQQLQVTLSNDGAVAGMLGQNLFIDRTMKFNEEQLRKIEALTPADVQAAFRKYVTPDRLIIIRAGDFEKPRAATD
jgi:zinc protease